MAGQNQLLDIEIQYNQLTKTEKRIADYVLANKNKVLFMSITELADVCGVAEASVHRFCRSVGAKGYQEFKMKLSLDSTTSEEDKTTPSAESSEKQVLYRSILDNHINAIRETNALLDHDMVERIVTMMTEARNIMFFGIGDSWLAAEEARNKFIRITSKVRAIQDPHMQAMAASMADSGDLMIFISYSGATKDNVYIANIAKEAGARIVVITRFLKSPLTSYADAVMICGSNEGPLEGGSLGARMGQLHIIDVLFQAYYQRNPKLSRTNHEKTVEAVADKLL